MILPASWSVFDDGLVEAHRWDWFTRRRGDAEEGRVLMMDWLRLLAGIGSRGGGEVGLGGVAAAWLCSEPDAIAAEIILRARSSSDRHEGRAVRNEQG